MKKSVLKPSKSGFTLIEAIVGLTIFAIIAVGVYQTFSMATQLIYVSRLMITSAALSTEQFEIIHNLPYADVGIVSGIPSGVLTASQNITRDNANFLVETTIHNIDDPFDGTIGGTPNDSSPADYKSVEITISVPGNSRFKPQTYTEYVAPKNLENSSTNGALFVRVFDANGQPIEGANVHIENNSTTPATIIDDVTNKDGDLQIVDVPPGIEVYEITVSKTGYSQEKTYPNGDPGNPNPVKAHATVLMQQVTQISFAIDIGSTLNVESLTETCGSISNVSFSLVGAKLIGLSPDVLKYSEIFSTNASGVKTINNLEWDTYNLTITDSLYDLAGTISPIPFSLTPGSTQDVKVVTSLKNPNSLLVGVKQGGSGLPLSGATVKLEKTGFESELITGRGFLRQTDWTGGSGQDNLTDQTKYFSSDGNIETNNPAGEIKLKDAFGEYAGSGALISSTFDTGSVSNFYQIIFTPQDQPVQTGADSVKLQVATNNDNATWSFKGPDGTDGSFYSAADTNINSVHNGDRYFRYQIYLSTASTTYTPNVGEISFTFSSLCVPPGQVMFSGLDNDSYTLTISKSGYQTSVENINISQPWQQHEITLMPE